MKTRNAAFGFVVCVVALCSTQTVNAADRECWKFCSGSFVKMGGSNWQERGCDGLVKFHFVEKARTNEYVELYDKSRDITIRLRCGISFIHYGKDPMFSQLYQGSWCDSKPGLIFNR